MCPPKSETSGKKKKSPVMNHARDFHYGLLAERSFDLVIAQNLERKIVYVNHVWSNALGYSAEESIGKPAIQFVAPEYHEEGKKRNTKKRRRGP